MLARFNRDSKYKWLMNECQLAWHIVWFFDWSSQFLCRDLRVWRYIDWRYFHTTPLSTPHHIHIMAQKESFSQRDSFQSDSHRNKATGTRESSTEEPSQVPAPVYSGQFLAGAHHLNIDNSNFTSIQTQYVTVNNATDVSGGPLEGLENQVLVCPSPSPHFTGREDILGQLSDIFSPPVVTLYGPKEEELSNFVRNHVKWWAYTQDSAVINLTNGLKVWISYHHQWQICKQFDWRCGQELKGT